VSASIDTLAPESGRRVLTKYLGGLFVFFLAVGMLALAFLTPAAGGYESRYVSSSVDPLFERRNEEGDSGAVLYGRYCSGCWPAPQNRVQVSC